MPSHTQRLQNITKIIKTFSEKNTWRITSHLIDLRKLKFINLSLLSIYFIWEKNILILNDYRSDPHGKRSLAKYSFGRKYKNLSIFYSQRFLAKFIKKIHVTFKLTNKLS